MNRTILANHTGNLEILVGIIDAVKNDKEVRKAHSESLKLLEQTDEEIRKVEELKTLTARNDEQMEELEKLKNFTQSERKKLETERSDLEAQKLSFVETAERLRKEKQNNERVAAQNEEVKKQQEGHSQFINNMKAEYTEKNKKLEERERALDIRAEKILLREKASDL
jgi:hypothetical protein